MANRLDFARGVLSLLGAPDTPDNEAAMLTWMWAEEGPGINDGASFNPLNISAGDYPHSGTGGAGAYAFVSFDQGVQVTADFLHQGIYAGIVSALQSGGSGSSVLQAIQDSPWAASQYGGQLVGEISGTLADWAGRAGAPIAGAPPGGALGSGGVGVQGATSGTAAGGSATATNASITSSITDSVVQPILKGAMRIVLTGVAVAAGLALIVIGATRVVAPSVQAATDQASDIAGPVAAAAAL